MYTLNQLSILKSQIKCEKRDSKVLKVDAGWMMEHCMNACTTLTGVLYLNWSPFLVHWNCVFSAYGTAMIWFNLLMMLTGFDPSIEPIDSALNSLPANINREQLNWFVSSWLHCTEMSGNMQSEKNKQVVLVCIVFA